MCAGGDCGGEDTVISLERSSTAAERACGGERALALVKAGRERGLKLAAMVVGGVPARRIAWTLESVTTRPSRQPSAGAFGKTLATRNAWHLAAGPEGVLIVLARCPRALTVLLVMEHPRAAAPLQPHRG